MKLPAILKYCLCAVTLLLAEFSPAPLSSLDAWFLHQNALAASDAPAQYGTDNPESQPRPQPESDPDYVKAIWRAAGMVSDTRAQQLAADYGLHIVNVTWEDTGRYYNSAVGPNISDATIQVQYRDPQTGEYQLALMPVIRYPNFSDLTADVSPDLFYLLTGNERVGAAPDQSREHPSADSDLQRITLTEYLRNFRNYLSDPGSWPGRKRSLLAPRDTHVLVSAQAAFLPIPAGGVAEFNPVIFNYQSYPGDPAVLVIVATREGTSATVIDNVRDAFPAGWSWGQRLFFNQHGERASFTGQRLSDFSQGAGSDPYRSPQAAGESGLNLVLLIQVPLKQKLPFRAFPTETESLAGVAPMAAEKSDIETAVIGHGQVEGPFTEIDGLEIERDPRFPVRVTVQFYLATSNGMIAESDMELIARQIERVYSDADYVGSLVVDGPSPRPTEYAGPKDEPPGWWAAFWDQFERQIGLTRQEALRILRSLGAYTGRWIGLPSGK